MNVIDRFHVRRTSLFPLVAGLALAACVTHPAGAPTTYAKNGIGSGTEGRGNRLTVMVTDQNAAPLNQVTVELRGLGKDLYRAVTTTDGFGVATFNDAPSRVEIDVTAPNGFASTTTDVPPEGTEVYMIVQTYGPAGTISP
ncbi:MAG TPA: hypothetical protein VMH77_03230 [Steroidobacteraceae bacterium]|nr:hypothetical protein [Steroidobacteraceae bacterium]